MKDEYIKETFRVIYKQTSLYSKDPVTQVGALIVNEDESRSVYGANRPPPSVKLTDERRERPAIYGYINHAEEDSVFRCAKQGVSAEGAIMYAPWSACLKCAKSIISAGIYTLVRHKEMMEKTPAKWIDDIKFGDSLLREANVEIIEWSGVVGDCTNMFGGEIWLP